MNGYHCTPSLPMTPTLRRHGTQLQPCGYSFSIRFAVFKPLTFESHSTTRIVALHRHSLGRWSGPHEQPIESVCEITRPLAFCATMSSVTPFPTNSLFRFPFKGDALDQYTWHLLTFINNPPSCGLALTIPLDVVSPVHTNGTRGVLNAIDTHWPLQRSKSTLTGRWYFVLRLGSAKYLLVAVFVGLHEWGLEVGMTYDHYPG